MALTHGIDKRLTRPAADAGFGRREIYGLPEPVCQYLTAAMTQGTPLAASANLRMTGRLKIGRRWLPYRAREVLAPHRGFVWTARVGGMLSGSDRYVDGQGSLSWKLLGTIPVMRADGPDVSRSAAARGAAEAVWVPTTLLPRFGVHWTAEDSNHITALYDAGDVELAVHYVIDSDGGLRSLSFDRWGDPEGTGTWGFHPFGIDVTGHTSFGPVTVPSDGVAGWFHGTERWDKGRFFEFHLSALDLVTTPP